MTKRGAHTCGEVSFEIAIVNLVSPIRKIRPEGDSRHLFIVIRPQSGRSKMKPDTL